MRVFEDLQMYMDKHNINNYIKHPKGNILPTKFRLYIVYINSLRWPEVLPVTETQWAQPAAAFTTEASVGSGKGSGVSFRTCGEKKLQNQFKEFIL